MASSFTLGSKRGQLVLLLMLCNACLYLNRANMSVTVTKMYSHEADKALVLSGFYFGYPLTQVFAGYMAATHGGKPVLLCAVTLWSIATILIIPAYEFGPFAVAAARFLLGCAEGANYPAMTSLVSSWFPLQERSRAWALLTAGESIGTILALSGCEFLMHFAGWRVVMLVSTAVGVAWGLAFALVASSKPETAGVSAAELEHITAGRCDVSREGGTGFRNVPWRAILRSQALWAIIVPHFCFNWGYYLVLSVLPDYYKSSFHMKYEEMGIVTILPYISLFFVTNLGAAFADKVLLERCDCPLRTVRKLMTALGFCLGALFFSLFATVHGCGEPTGGMSCPGSMWATVFVTCAQASTGLTFSGFQVNFVDVSRTYAPQLMGISNSIAAIPGILGNLSVQWFHSNYTIIFLFAAGLQLLGCTWYCVLGLAEDQHYERSKTSTENLLRSDAE